jgi:ABC-type nitrate/sulfonate/bicarbonate transport system substrate-binding protein
MKPKLMTQALSWLVAVLVGSFTVPPTAVNAKSLTFAYQTPTLSGTLPIFAAVEMGLFAAQNLEVKPVFVRGGPTALAALISGDVDYATIAGIPAVRAIAQGGPVVIAGGYQPYVDYTLIGAKGIANLNDLKGKVVGVTGAGGIAEFAAVEGLARKGFVRDRDYKILYGVGNSPARVSALESGRIQAAPFSFTERINLEVRGFPVLFDIGQVMPKFPFVVLVTSRRKAESAPEEVTAFLRAMKRVMDFIRTDKERVLSAVLNKGSYGDPGMVRKVIDHFSDVYSIAIGKEDVEALISATKLTAEAKKLGGPEKFFLGDLLTKALGPSH